MKKYQSYIGGKWIDSLSKETIPVDDPATGKILGEMACAKKEDVDLAIEAASKAFKSRILVDMHPLERVKLMRKIAEELRKVSKEPGKL